LHYRKIQMLIFPYLERMGVIPIPRVMWGREDGVIVKLRSLIQETEKALSERNTAKLRELASGLRDLSREIVDLVFRENKILYPAVHALLPEGAWTVVSEIADEIGYIVEKGETSWKPRAPPVYPYEWVPVVNEQVLEKLPVEFKHAVEKLKPDDYRVQRDEDLVLETGFLSREEIEGIFRSLPLELTFADANNRVRFYTESEITGGFVRTKTILGRRLEYCHPPRLEKYVMQNVEAVKQGKFRYREFWTKQGDRIMRVLVIPVKARDGRYLGVLEVVEDLTDVVEHPEEVKKKIMVL
ncbi:MAG: PAS domain-containing protein, partial [Desulfurococcaceae archaeon]